MQLSRASVMGIPSRNYTAPAGGTGAYTKKGIFKQKSFRGNPVNIGSFHLLISIATYVISANIVAYYKDYIGLGMLIPCVPG